MTASNRSRATLSTLYQRISQGLWTQPVKLGPRAVGWPADEVSALIAARIAGQSDEAIRGLVRQLEAARTARDGGSMVAAPSSRHDTAEPAVGPLVDEQVPRPHPTRLAPAHDAWTDPGTPHRLPRTSAAARQVQLPQRGRLAEGRYDR